MAVNVRPFLALVASFLALVLLDGSWSIILATKPVPRAESMECKHARVNYKQAKEKYNNHKANWEGLKRQADSAWAGYLKAKNYYKNNCDRKPDWRKQHCKAALNRYSEYKGRWNELKRLANQEKAEGAKTKAEALRIGNWYKQNCKGASQPPPSDANRSRQAGEWKCWSNQGRQGFCIMNGCHPKECYWKNSVTGEEKYDHQPEPPGGWIK